MKNVYIIAFWFISISNSFAQQITFQKIFGGTGGDIGNSVLQTTDGGYIIAGYSNSFGAGYSDVYLLKTDNIGNIQWNKTYGGASADIANLIYQTNDGGYIVIGWTESFGAGQSDIYLIKTNSSGDTIWTKSYGGSMDEFGFAVEQTNDGGYIISGTTSSFGAGIQDVYLIRTDTNGNALWSKTFGGIYSDVGNSVHQTTDGGYIIAGTTNNFGPGSWNVYLIKTDSSGDTIWTKSYGGITTNSGNSVEQTNDGGYIIIGYTWNIGAGVKDAYLIKIDSSGNMIWSKTYGGTVYDTGESVQQTNDGGYIMVGYTDSFGASGNDIYIIKTDSGGSTLWSKIIGGIDAETGFSVQQTNDNGYIIAGGSSSFSTNGMDVYLLKTDSLGNSGCNDNNVSTIVNIPSTIVINSATTVATPSTLTSSTATIVANGGITTTLCTSVGISSTPNLNLPISLSPNPATTNFTITFPNIINKGAIEIYNVLGERVMEESVFSVSAKEIRLKDIPSGIYVVKVNDGSIITTMKLIRE